mmetsp:Transcript_400/g.929  ORF Transcript_400/g.929 Transcript_400/m.929 type:complete len:213 (-) Transcript_400:488-1126(-)
MLPHSSRSRAKSHELNPPKKSRLPRRRRRRLLHLRAKGWPELICPGSRSIARAFWRMWSETKRSSIGCVSSLDRVTCPTSSWQAHLAQARPPRCSVWHTLSWEIVTRTLCSNSTHRTIEVSLWFERRSNRLHGKRSLFHRDVTRLSSWTKQITSQRLHNRLCGVPWKCSRTAHVSLWRVTSAARSLNPFRAVVRFYVTPVSRIRRFLNVFLR